MSDITITLKATKIYVASPYNEDFVAAARELAGKFDATTKAWVFDARDEPRVRELLVRIYGSDGSQVAQTVTLHVDLGQFGTHYDKVIVAGRVVARRSGRDYPVRLSGAVIIEGGFPSSGGSMKNPALEYVGYVAGTGRTVLEVRDVPAGHADVTAKGVTIVGEAVDRDVLVAERAALMARLAQIDALLA